MEAAFFFSSPVPPLPPEPHWKEALSLILNSKPPDDAEPEEEEAVPSFVGVDLTATSRAWLGVMPGDR